MPRGSAARATEQDRAHRARELEHDVRVGAELIVRLDEDAADRDVDHADVGAVLQTCAAKPADIVEAEAHVTAPFGIVVRIDDGVGEAEDLDVGRVQFRDGHNVRNS